MLENIYPSSTLIDLQSRSIYKLTHTLKLVHAAPKHSIIQYVGCGVLKPLKTFVRMTWNELNVSAWVCARCDTCKYIGVCIHRKNCLRTQLSNGASSALTNTATMTAVQFHMRHRLNGSNIRIRISAARQIGFWSCTRGSVLVSTRTYVD